MQTPTTGACVTVRDVRTDADSSAAVVPSAADAAKEETATAETDVVTADAATDRLNRAEQNAVKRKFISELSSATAAPERTKRIKKNSNSVFSQFLAKMF